MYSSTEGHTAPPQPEGSKTNITLEEINNLPLKSFEGDIVLVNDAEAAKKAFAEIEKHNVVGFDTETRPSFHKGQFYNVALLQLALPQTVFLVRLSDTGF